jgi:hypothetical protein
MGHTSKAKKRRKKDAAIIVQGFIKLPEGEKNINQTDIDRMAQIDYPLFSFKHLQKVSFDGDVKAKFFQDFLLRLKKYSDLGWKQMATEKRHDYGWEYLPQDRMKNKLPAVVTPEVQLMVLRSANDKRAMVGFREWNIYHVIFIEAVFNEIYEHGK